MALRNYILKHYPRLSRLLYPRQVAAQELFAGMVQNLSFNQNLQTIPMFYDPSEELWEETFNNMVKNAQALIEEIKQNAIFLEKGNYCAVIFLARDKYWDNFVQAIKGFYVYKQHPNGKWEKLPDKYKFDCLRVENRHVLLIDKIPEKMSISYPNSFGQFEEVSTGRLYKKIPFTI